MDDVDSVKDESAQKIEALRLELASNYIPKNEYNRTIDKLEDEVFKELNRLSDEMYDLSKHATAMGRDEEFNM